MSENLEAKLKLADEIINIQADRLEELSNCVAVLEAKLAKMQRSRDRYREAWEAEKTRTTLADLKEKPND